MCKHLLLCREQLLKLDQLTPNMLLSYVYILDFLCSVQMVLAQYCVLWVKLMTASEITMCLILLGLFPIVFFKDQVYRLYLFKFIDNVKYLFV